MPQTQMASGGPACYAACPFPYLGGSYKQVDDLHHSYMPVGATQGVIAIHPDR
jgi:hypothetical protein